MRMAVDYVRSDHLTVNAPSCRAAVNRSISNSVLSVTEINDLVCSMTGMPPVYRSPLAVPGLATRPAPGESAMSRSVS